MAVAEATTTQQRRAGLGWRVAGAFLRRREASILVVAGALIAFFWIKRADAFGGSDNWKNITETLSPYAIVSAGEVMLLICGEIDLAVGNVFALAHGRLARTQPMLPEQTVKIDPVHARGARRGAHPVLVDAQQHAFRCI